jgi:predicted ATP-grasp superfamily ATP-dependent carboligase
MCYPSPRERGSEFQARIFDEMRSNRYRVLIPMTDITMRLVARMRESLAPLVRMTVPSEHQVELAQDKRHVLLLAQQLGIGFPCTRMLDPRENLVDVAHATEYPVVIKPRFSWWPRNGRWVSGSVQYAHNPEELFAKYHESHRLIPEPLVQEKIEGEGRGVFLLLWKGELKAAFCHRRLREKPPWGGVSVYRESIPLDEKLIKKSTALMQAIGWEGPAMLEFKLDKRDGQEKLMEVNARFWGSLQLAIDAGINFPLMLYRLSDGEEVACQLNYKAGVKSRWLLGDLDHLLIRMTHSSESNGYSKDDVSRLRAFFNFMKLYERDMYYEIFRLDDQGPGWHEGKSYLRDLMRRFGAKGGSADAR